MAGIQIKAQSIQELTKRHRELDDARITAAADHKNARQQLDALKADALAKYGTDDLEALRAKLKEMEADNDRKRAEYQTHLDKIDADLKEIEQKHNQPFGQK